MSAPNIRNGNIASSPAHPSPLIRSPLTFNLKLITMGTFNNNSTWGKILNIVITILTAIATTFGTASCM